MELRDLEPRPLWGFFSEILSVPHPSRQEEALARRLAERCRARGFVAERDGAGNLIVRAPASPGMEGRVPMILQAHLDMVPQKEAELAFDFSRDPVLPRLDPEDPAWLRASGTTLGADNGIGVAAALAVLEDPAARHGPLEVLLTVNEEDGMDGARGLEPGKLRGRLLLNLDGELEDELCLGCAGGYRLRAAWDFPADPVRPGDVLLELRVEGLLGGHSGGDIHLGRGNAILLLSRILAEGMGPAPGCRLVSLEGGSVPNVIPREARALVSLPRGEEANFRAACWREETLVKAALEAADPGFAFAIVDAPASAARTDEAGARTARAAGAAESHRLVAALARLPNGARAMSEEIPGLVRLSSNLGRARAGAAAAAEPSGGAADGPAAAGAPPRFAAEILVLARGADDEEKARYAEELRAALGRSGAFTERLSHYPGWRPDLASPLLAVAKEAYEAALGREPRLRATHGGLECGLFRAAYPDWDMLSLGPDIRFPHSPSEAVRIASVGNFYKVLVEILARAPSA